MNATPTILRHLLNALCGALVMLSLSACATQWQGSDTSPIGIKLSHQRNATGNSDGIRPISARDLMPGDLLFSANDKGINSLAIRLMTHSAVSHAFIYLGNEEVAEAVGGDGVRITSLDDALRGNSLIAAYRRPDLTTEDSTAINQFARSLAGEKYNLFGIAKQAPYSVARKACELPVVPRAFRHLCLNSTALITITPLSSEKYFCSQFVVAAFNHAGKPLTEVPPEWVSPNDLLHMRENDIPSLVPSVPLQYVGHLSCSASLWNGGCQVALQSSGSAQ